MPDLSVPDRSVNGPDPSDASGRVLVAEDNVVNERVAVAMLRHLGIDADVVADGGDAVNAALSTPYRAILMDCQIPGLDGFDATREIRRRQGSSRHTPIIAVTSSVSAAHRQLCLEAGMDDYLAKPLRLQSLAAMLDRWAPFGPVDSAGQQPVDTLQVSAAAASSDPGRPVLDALIVARLERLGASSGEDLVGQLATLFLADSEVRINDLRLALAAGNTAEVFRAAHTLMGSSANLGATELSRLCSILATDGADTADADMAAATALVDRIEAELGRVRVALGVLAIPVA